MSDPGLQSLRRGARVAVVMPLVFAFFLNGVDNSEAALFAGFGAFAFLGFADFGGAPRHRTNAYLTLTVVGAALVTLGTVISNEALVVALVGVIVATSTRFVGSFGGYFSAAVSPIILAFVLSASVPAPAAAVPDRVLGWVVAGLISTVAALVLWPRRERLQLRDAARAAAAAFADHVETLPTASGASQETRDATERALNALVSAAAVPQRPAGPSAHDAALSFLVDQLERIGVLIRANPRVEVPPDALGLAALGAKTLRAVAHTLESGNGPDDLDEQITTCFDARIGVVHHAVHSIEEGEAAGGVIDRIDDLTVERVVLLLSASALANASIVVGGPAPSSDSVSIPARAPLIAGDEGTITRLRTMLRANAVPTSAFAQDAVRAGIAIGAALLIAGELKLDHGFWVVLGTLSVLRSNAFETGRSAVFASFGTAIGFAVSSALLAVVGFDHLGLWIIVVAGFFLSAYTPQVLGFVAGQVSFTIAVVAMFNLIEPQGWHTGLVRLENILIGSAVSAAVALMFWPRRASTGLRKNAVELYRTLATELPARIADIDAPDLVGPVVLRAHAGYVQYLSETARRPADRAPWSRLLGDASQVRFSLDLLPRHRDYAGLRACGPTRTAFGRVVQDVARALDATAGELEGDTDASPVDVDRLAVETRAPIAECLTNHAHDGRDGVLAAAVDAALVRDLLVDVAGLADEALATVPKLPD